MFRAIRISTYVLCSLCSISIFAGRDVRAELIIDYDTLQMGADGTGVLNVYATARGKTEDLAAYNALFRVTSSTGDGILEFADPQLATETAVGTYVFANQTDVGNFFLSQRKDTDKLELLQADITFDAQPATLSPGNRFLLGSLDLKHIFVTGATFNGASYRIQLIEDPSKTFFQESDFSTNIAIAAESFSNFGTVNITAVPEPSSVILVSLVGASLWLRRKQRHTSN